ncbi:1-deoxy-D-xylulose-5-phosphate reductoisomerase [Clostridium lundense]|uniref:1-deoxy-D-xylulose-5-phosphate reductoisomerase n=1 Tax=Clostridium lundense TaxID=319475 RepID=UPI000486146A|nr:1-deoxy-D-xylulose-5-phosphate reductoisomerase [Clostridium lundense]
MKNICILGATGSIGTQALEVIRKEKDNFSLTAVSANKSWERVAEIINEFNPKYAALMDNVSYEKLKIYCNENNKNTEILFGIEGLNTIASLDEVDIVLTSVVGMIGLRPTLKAIQAGKDIALANKETLVVAGEIIIEEALKNNVKILPVDSEHGAIFQCLRGNSNKDVNKILLTASGGPFRGKSTTELRNVTVDEALKHPRWNMGKKISIDSATLMNKGLEVIEAHFLFNVDYDDIQVIVHPESIVHSMVEYKDGSIIAQLGTTDMKLPIQYAFNFPERKEAVVEKLDFYKIKNLTFEKPDMETFKPLRLAYEAGKAEGLMPAILNAANEIAVELFLNKRIKFLDIGDILEETMSKFNENHKVTTIEEIIEIDEKVRQYLRNKYFL